MPTLKQLQAQNKKLRDQISKKSELKKLEEERVILGRQNKALIKQLKRSPNEKAVIRTLNQAGRGFLKGGASIGRGLVRYGRFLDERQKQLERNSRTVKKRSSKKRITNKKRKSNRG